MPRIRTIKPEMFESERLGRCSPLARLTFVGLIALADDEGRGRGSLEWLKGRLHPYDVRSQRNLYKATNELAVARLAIFYTVDSRVFYYLPGWPDNQKISHPCKSKFPAPPEGEPSLFAAPPEDSGEFPETLRDSPEKFREDLGSRIRDLGSGIKEGPRAVPARALTKVPEGNGNGKGPAPKKKFEPPAPDEVRTWLESKHPDWLRSGVVSPVKFCAYYESQGWRVGKNPMKDWKAAVVNWANK